MTRPAGSRPLFPVLALIAVGFGGVILLLLTLGIGEEPGPGDFRKAARPDPVETDGSRPASPPEKVDPDPARSGKEPGQPLEDPVVSPAANTRPEPVSPAEGFGTVTGRIVDSTDQAVAGARIEIRLRKVMTLGIVSFGPVKATGRTEKDGRFVLKKVSPASDYSLTLTHEHFAPGVHHRVRVRPAVATDVGTLRLLAGAVAWGQVRSLEKGGLQGIPVKVVDAALPEAFGGREAVVVRSGPAGRFRFSNLTPGKVRIEAVAEGHAPGGVDVTLKAGEEVGNIDLVLKRGLTLEGEVMDDRGILLENARILAASDRHTAETVTDSRGCFTVSALGEGIYRLFAQKKGYGRKTGDRSPRDFAAGTRGICITLERRAAFGGVVLDAGTGNPVLKFTVAWGEPGEDVLHTRAISSQEGRFLIEDLRPGPIVIEVRSPDHASHRFGEIRLSPGERAEDHRIHLRAGGAVKGRVVRAGTGEPLARVRVRAVPVKRTPSSVVIGGKNAKADPGLRSASTDEEGRFVLGHLSGVYDLEIRSPGLAPLDVKRVRFPESGVLDIGEVVMGVGGTIKGFVAGPSGKGDDAAEVWIHSGTGYDRRVATDREGRFMLGFVPPGVYRVVLTRRAGKLALEDLIKMSTNGGTTVKVGEGEVATLRF